LRIASPQMGQNFQASSAPIGGTMPDPTEEEREE